MGNAKVDRGLLLVLSVMLRALLGHTRQCLDHARHVSVLLGKGLPWTNAKVHRGTLGSGNEPDVLHPRLTVAFKHRWTVASKLSELARIATRHGRL